MSRLFAIALREWIAAVGSQTAYIAPGSPWEQYWEVLGTLALIFVVDSLVNLVPAGELDGARLLQLVTRSEKGKSYLAALRSGKVDPTIGTALNTPPLPSR